MIALYTYFIGKNGYLITIVILTILYLFLKNKRPPILDWLNSTNLLFCLYALATAYTLYSIVIALKQMEEMQGEFISSSYRITSANSANSVGILIVAILFLFRKPRRSFIISWIPIVLLVFPWIYEQFVARANGPLNELRAGWHLESIYPFWYYFAAILCFNVVVLVIYLIQRQVTRKNRLID